jgi:hypothetical protein
MKKGRGSLFHRGSLYFSFNQKWSKFGTLPQTDPNEAEMKEKFKIFDSASSYIGHYYFDSDPNFDPEN